MNVEYRFLSISELGNYLSYPDGDSEKILSSGLDLYKTSIVKNPNRSNNDFVVCLAIADNKIVGRFMLFQTKLKVETEVIEVQTGGGILVKENYRGFGIGKTLIQIVLCNDFHLGALYTRAAYNIVKKTETMLEIPQYVKFLHHGIKKILDIPILITQFLLRKYFYIEKLSIVPNWVNDMIINDNHKYMEVHDASWLQWSLDNNATGNMNDYQSFYAIYNKTKQPVGFFMTKVRTIKQEGRFYKKANLVEWASLSKRYLDEADINILALSTLDSSIEKFWTISENEYTAKKLKRYFFKRKGWFAISVGKNQRFEDIGDVNKWRIRYGCCNTILVE